MPTIEVILTIGYEGRSIEEVIELLKAKRVQVLVDARARAQSRKHGFSKTRLAEAVSAAGIEYQHRRDLGTPPNLMKQMKESGHYELKEYAKYLDGDNAAITRAAEELAGRIALLCYELDPNQCHRSVVADRLSRVTGAPIEHV